MHSVRNILSDSCFNSLKLVLVTLRIYFRLLQLCRGLFICRLQVLQVTANSFQLESEFIFCILTDFGQFLNLFFNLRLPLRWSLIDNLLLFHRRDVYLLQFQLELLLQIGKFLAHSTQLILQSLTVDIFDVLVDFVYFKRLIFLILLQRFKQIIHFIFSLLLYPKLLFRPICLCL